MAIEKLYHPLDRRTALRTLLLAGGVASTLACAPPAAPSPAAPAASPNPPSKPAAPAPAPTTPAAAPTQAPAKAKSLQSITIILDWTPFGYHAPFWVAAEKGYFAQNGLDPKIQDGKGSQTTLQLVASGQAPVGYLDAGVMIQGVPKGIDARMVGCFYQKNAYGIISPADAPLTTPQDLVGKKLAVVPGDANSQMFPNFAKKAGVSESSVTLVNTDPNGIYAALMGRKVDGAFHQVPTAAATYASQNFPVKTLLYADYGLARLGSGIVLMNKTISGAPDMVRGVMAALSKGWQVTAENPTVAIETSRKVVDVSTPTETLVSHFTSLLPFARTEKTKDTPLFWMDKQDWEGTQTLMLDTGALTEARSADVYFTNEYISKN